MNSLIIYYNNTILSTVNFSRTYKMGHVYTLSFRGGIFFFLSKPQLNNPKQHRHPIFYWYNKIMCKNRTVAKRLRFRFLLQAPRNYTRPANKCIIIIFIFFFFFTTNIDIVVTIWVYVVVYYSAFDGLKNGVRVDKVKTACSRWSPWTIYLQSMIRLITSSPIPLHHILVYVADSY